MKVKSFCKMLNPGLRVSIYRDGELKADCSARYAATQCLYSESEIENFDFSRLDRVMITLKSKKNRISLADV